MTYKIILFDDSSFSNVQIQRIEEQHNIFSFVILQRNFFELPINNCIAFESRCWLSHCGSEEARGGAEVSSKEARLAQSLGLA